ncbi:MAG: hypothetical protein H2056_07930 [Sphingopyxis sp.]|nr:hypothetical protein [Sphingopyxis sp.]
MTSLARLTLVLPILLAACGTGDETKTTTKLDAVEVQPGSASDAMIMLDDADVDGTAVDNSGAFTAEGAAAAKAEAEQAAENAPVDEAAEEGAAEPASESPAE